MAPTPPFMASLEERFGKFTLDVAAAAHNAKAPNYYTRERRWAENALGGCAVAAASAPPYRDCWRSAVRQSRRCRWLDSRMQTSTPSRWAVVAADAIMRQTGASRHHRV